MTYAGLLERHLEFQLWEGRTRADASLGSMETLLEVRTS